ncbi:TPA: glycosyltransferase family 2 protein [Escherichia coli]
MNNKIIACMVVKNEVDIIEYTLEQALKWADYILVLDNNSTDGTTDVIKKMSELEQKIIFWGGYGGPFRDSLRAVIYNDYYYLCNDGDWWCRLDADEVYIDNPREFLSSMDESIDHVYSASFQYYLTKRMLENEEQNTRKFDISNYKYFKCNWSEIRFIKIKKSTIWPLHFANPLFLLKPSSRRIRLKHFQYRNSKQMEKRFRDRSPEEGKNLFSHELKQNKVWDETDLTYDQGLYEYDDEILPRIKKISTFRKVIFSCIVYGLKKFSLERILLPTKEKV